MGYVLFFNLRAGVMDSVIWDTFSILCVNINNEATLDRMDESKSKRFKVRGTIVDAEGGSVRLVDCKFMELQ